GRISPRISPELNWYQVYLPSTVPLTHGRRNPLAAWLDSLGAFGFRAYEKRVPAVVFEQPTGTIALFLRHLWATDGSIRPPGQTDRHPSIYYASSSEGLTRDVQSLLLRLGINSVVKPSDQGDKGRMQYHAYVMGHDDILLFADRVGAVGEYKSSSLA